MAVQWSSFPDSRGSESLPWLNPRGTYVIFLSASFNVDLESRPDFSVRPKMRSGIILRRNIVQHAHTPSSAKLMQGKDNAAKADPRVRLSITFVAPIWLELGNCSLSRREIVVTLR